MTTDEIIAGMTEAQRAAIIASVDALAELAGDGYCVAEDAIFDLHNAFGGDGSMEYGEWIRARLMEERNDG